jgi:hypothetical protein
VLRETVYVAGPIGKPENHSANVDAALQVASQLLDAGLYPFVPHLCVWWDLHTPRHYESWMKFDMVWLKRCDVLLRIPGHSPGADREVALAKEVGIPVFFELGDVFMWARKR